jgi:hypothetical protein
MNLGRPQTEEEKAAKAAEQARQQELKTHQKAVADEQARLHKESEARERQRQEFLASPAGSARAAFDSGDRLFQFFMDVKDTKPVVIPMVGARTTTKTADPVAILNSVCNEGWELVNGSFVFHELGSESRDKFLASGQNVAVRGTIIGYYLFKRCEENRKTSPDTWDVPAIERACPHCGASMSAAATLCPQCHQESQAWQFNDGRWWRAVGADWHYLDESTGDWRKHEVAHAAGVEDGSEG